MQMPPSLSLQQAAESEQLWCFHLGWSPRVRGQLESWVKDRDAARAVLGQSQHY